MKPTLPGPARPRRNHVRSHWPGFNHRPVFSYLTPAKNQPLQWWRFENSKPKNSMTPQDLRSISRQLYSEPMRPNKSVLPIKPSDHFRKYSVITNTPRIKTS